jgi:hypothetical protein
MLEIPDQKLCEQIATIAAEEGEEPVPIGKVVALFAAYNNIMQGDPVGTMRVNSENGAIAVRVVDNGLHIWRINVPKTGEQYNDLQPTLQPPEIWEKMEI